MKYEHGYYWVKKKTEYHIAVIGYDEGSNEAGILLNGQEYTLANAIEEGLEVICKVPPPEELPKPIKTITIGRVFKDFSRIEGSYTTPDKLTRKVYRFEVIHNVVMLEEYREESRPTKRHGWVTDKIWKRIGVGGGWRNTVEYPIDTVPWEKAVNSYKDELVFGFPEGLKPK